MEIISKKELTTMKKAVISFLLVLMLAIMNTSNFVGAEEIPTVKQTGVTESVMKLKCPMQRLWTEHAWWTRNYIISNLADLKDQNHILKRLLKNQEDTGNLIKPYYGVEAGNKLTALLKEHILIAGKIIDAAKKGENAKVAQFNKDWHRNADQIVDFLTKANPNWSKQVLTSMFYTHLKLTTTEVEDHLKGNWADEIKTVDINQNHLIHMGNVLADGIIKQFPHKFK